MSNKGNPQFLFLDPEFVGRNYVLKKTSFNIEKPESNNSEYCECDTPKISKNKVCKICCKQVPYYWKIGGAIINTSAVSKLDLSKGITFHLPTRKK